MSFLKQIHHIAVICSDYELSKQFYTTILQLEVIKEIYREDRNSYKLDLSLNGQYILELFSFKQPPKRPSQPEATGLRHLAFTVDSVDISHRYFCELGVRVEDIRLDEFTGKKFFFLFDPDNLPIEIYQS